jgi:hypothetical protein
MDIKQIEDEIKKLQVSIKVSLKRTVGDAIEIGHLLMDAKQQLGHGQYEEWVTKQGLSKKSAWNYAKCFEYSAKTVKLTDLTEAYKLVESEENKRKQIEFKAQSNRVDQFKNTGVKPEGWDDKTDSYRVKKEKDDEGYRERKRMHLEEVARKSKNEKSTAEVLAGLNDLSKSFEIKNALLKKMRLSGDNAQEPIYDALLEYLLSLTDNTRLEACHNIIKFCKGIAGECQKKSVRG